MSADRLRKRTSSSETKLPQIPEDLIPEDVVVVHLPPPAPFTHAAIQNSLGVPEKKDDKDSLSVPEKKEGQDSHAKSLHKRKNSMQKAAPFIAAEIMRHKQKIYKDNEHFYNLITIISKWDDMKEEFKDEPTIQRNFETWLEDPSNNSSSSSKTTSFNYLIGRYLLDLIAKHLVAYMMQLQEPMIAAHPDARKLFEVKLSCTKKLALLDNEKLLAATLLNWLTSLNPKIRQEEPLALFELFLTDLEDKKYEDLIKKPNKPIWIYVKPPGCCESFFKTYVCCCFFTKRNKTTASHPKTLHAHPSTTTITVAPAPLPKLAS